MSDVVIKIENLSKQYRLGLIGTGTLSHDLNRWWCRMRGKEDPYLKVTQTNVRDKRGDSEFVWALRDVNFEVKQGEVLGIIGRNGAGKSTLLKILSRVTAPTTGCAKIKGRIASLLEVGTGFHPELTGRENIYLNGAILGMTKAEIAGKLDEIVAFSGCERYIDTPVKRYSSGMMVRLGFAVAAHLEPEILIVDEVLAVGDAEFQKKCIGKMQDISTGGRTVLFVSHNMGAVSALCPRVIEVADGRIVEDGPVEQVVQGYLTRGASTDGSRSWSVDSAPGESGVKLLSVRVCDSKGDTCGVVMQHEAFEFMLDFEVTDAQACLSLCVQLVNPQGAVVAHCSDAYQRHGDGSFEPGRYRGRLRFGPHILNAGYYVVNVLGAEPFVRVHFALSSVLYVRVERSDNSEGSQYTAAQWPGCIGPGAYEWQYGEVCPQGVDLPQEPPGSHSRAFSATSTRREQ